jgi:ribosomal protein S18 acetylase RimI-like enzyme
MPGRFRIAPARTAEDLQAVAALFGAYAGGLAIDLGFQNFAAEQAGLPGAYAPPAGALLLARGAAEPAETEEAPLGCVALRPLPSEGCCEMKRLYVSPAARGLGLGQALVQAILAEAARIGYREMRLDTLPSMTRAIALYRAAGFAPVPPYYDTPLAGTLFLGCRLPA